MSLPCNLTIRNVQQKAEEDSGRKTDKNKKKILMNSKTGSKNLLTVTTGPKNVFLVTNTKKTGIRKFS